MMMQCLGGTANMLSPAALYEQQPCTYRDRIRRVSVHGGKSIRSAVRFFPASSDAAADAEEAYYCWSSSSSSASSPALDDASARCSPMSSSFSSDDGNLPFSGCLDGVEELRNIAQQMVHDGYMRGLIRAFAAAGREELLLLGSWFSELDVDWVLLTREGSEVQPLLDLEDGCASLLDLMEKWIKALKTMVQVLCITQMELRAKMLRGVRRKAIRYFTLLATGKTELEVMTQFVRFAEASILRMLDFVDAVADAALTDDDDDRAAETLPGMLQVYTCVVEDSPAVLALFKQASSATSVSDAMNYVFMRKRSKLGNAIWSMMEKVRVSFMVGDCWSVSPDEAGGVHTTTRLMMNYVMLLWRNEGALSFVLHDSSPVIGLTKDLVSWLEKQLERTSISISDPGLRYLYLMNNYSFISKKVSSLLLPPWTTPMEDYKIDEKPRKQRFQGRLPPMEDYVNQPDPNLRAKIETDSNLDGFVRIHGFIAAYLDASWEPVMSCLYHGIHWGFLRCGGALDKFESEFQRTYATQKHWKVPNPELRKILRKAIIEKVIPGYSKYLAERTARGKSNTPHTSTPLELEELLEELFEG